MEGKLIGSIILNIILIIVCFIMLTSISSPECLECNPVTDVTYYHECLEQIESVINAPKVLEGICEQENPYIDLALNVSYDDNKSKHEWID